MNFMKLTKGISMVPVLAMVFLLSTQASADMAYVNGVCPPPMKGNRYHCQRRTLEQRKDEAVAALRQWQWALGLKDVSESMRIQNCLDQEGHIDTSGPMNIDVIKSTLQPARERKARQKLKEWFLAANAYPSLENTRDKRGIRYCFKLFNHEIDTAAKREEAQKSPPRTEGDSPDLLMYGVQ